MQDRFKFRIWDETEKNMVYFDGIFYNKKPYTEGSSFPQYESSPHYHELSDLMQCTGLKDKNGKLIFESDIVETWKFSTGRTEKKVVVFDVARCGCRLVNIFQYNRGMLDYPQSMVNVTTIKILGNIYENPELLEV